MSGGFDGVLMLGFGGPEPGCCERRPECSTKEGCEAPCFVSKILGDDPRAQGRIDEVVEHYRHFGGYSPYNDLTRNQAQALEGVLQLPVEVAFRHWRPSVTEGLQRLGKRGCAKVKVIIMAPHQSSRSWDDYIELVNEATEANHDLPEVVAFAPHIGSADGYAEAIRARIGEATRTWNGDRIRATPLILTAHAIPQPAERAGPYRQQIEETAEQVSAGLGFAKTTLAFQSAPERSRIPWSQPNIDDVIAELAGTGVTDCVIMPIGFLVDHMEVMFDLDVDAKEQLEKLGINLVRPPCVQDHPIFIRTMVGLLKDPVTSLAARQT